MELAVPAIGRKVTFDFRVEYPAALQLLAHVVYQIVAIMILHIPRPAGGLAVAVITPALLEVAVFAGVDRKVRFPASAIISGSGLYLLMESHRLFTYFLGGLVIVASKRLIRVNGKHIFNPSNIALLFTLYALPLGSTSAPMQWDSSLPAILFFFVVGAFVAHKANRHVAAYSYLAFFVAVSLLRAWATSFTPFFYAGTALAIPQMLFAFHMVTDPRTSPGAWRLQLLYGALIGTLEVALRWLAFFNAPFLALMAICAAWPLLPFAEET